MAIDWDNYESHNPNDPITEEMLQTYSETVNRIQHITEILGDYRPKFKTHQVTWDVDINPSNSYVAVTLTRYYRSGDIDEENDTFPVSYLLTPDKDIRATEAKAKAEREAAAKLAEARHEAEKRQSRIAYLKAELGRLEKL